MLRIRNTESIRGTGLSIKGSVYVITGIEEDSAWYSMILEYHGSAPVPPIHVSLSRTSNGNGYTLYKDSSSLLDIILGNITLDELSTNRGFLKKLEHWLNNV